MIAKGSVSDRIWIGLLCILSSVSMAAQEMRVIPISAFSQQQLNGWQEKSFIGHSLYDLVQLDKQWVLRAKSHGTASALFYQKIIDLKQTPYLNWRWRTVGFSKGFSQSQDETVKSGDDYVARVYVVRDGGLWVWNTLAINYVWSNQQPQFSIWDNAFAPNHNKMISLQDRRSRLNHWYSEKRNVLDDFLRLYPDENIKKIDGIAIMVDTDNTEGKAESYFADMYFSSR